MGHEEVPASIVTFIRGRITSVIQLEILLLLHSTSEKEWTAKEVSVRLSNNERSVNEQLARLASLKLLTSAKGPNGMSFRVNLEEAGQSSRLAELSGAYARWRFRVIDIIFAERAEELKNFSDSFRLRKENRDV